MTGPVSGADAYVAHRFASLTGSPNSASGLLRHATHDTNPNGGLHTGSLNDRPTRVGGYTSMSASDKDGFRQQFLREHANLSPDDRAQWDHHAQQVNQANGHGSAQGSSNGQDVSNVSGLQYLDQGRPSATGRGKAGPATNPAPPEGPLAPGTNEVVPNGNPNPLKMGTVSIGQNESGGESGIKVDGKWVTHGAPDASGRPTLVAAEPTKAPLSYGDQMAKAIELYPPVGVEGSPQNKAYVDAFNKGGQNQEGALDLAHSLFAPKTQAGVIAADDQATRDAAVKTAADAQANMTPAQHQIVQQRQDANHAAVAAAGKDIYDPDNTAKTVGQRIGDAIEGGSLDSFTGYWKDHLVNPVANAASSLWNGITGDHETSPPAPPLTTPPPMPPASNRMPDGTLGNAAPAPMPTAAPALPPPSAPSTTPPASSLSGLDYLSRQPAPAPAPDPLAGAPPPPPATAAASPPPPPPIPPPAAPAAPSVAAAPPPAKPAPASPAAPVSSAVPPPPTSPGASGLTANQTAQNTTNASAQGAAASTLANDPLLKSMGATPPPDGRIAAVPQANDASPGVARPADEEEGSAQAYLAKQKPA